VNAVRRWAALAITFLLGVAGLVLPGVVGDVASFVWLGVFPGMALARLLVPAAPPSTRWTLGIALSPLAAAVAGLALIEAGQPLPATARLVGLVSWILFAGGEARSMVSPAPAADDAPADRTAWAWMLGAALFVALPVLLNAWTRYRSDTWVHAGIVYEISERGIPPQDPRFAGMRLNYVWFYNLFLALLDGLRGGSPFTAIITANVCWMGAQVALGWQLAWTLWRERAAARAALPLLVLGLNAGALLLWPLWLLRAVVGDVRGFVEARRIMTEARWGTVDVIHQLNAPYAYMVNSWDKFTIGTALGYAYLLLLVLLWAAARWLEASRPDAGPAASGAWRWLVVAFAAAAGTMLFHSVVGLSVIPVSLGACLVFALLARRDAALGNPLRQGALAIAMAAGLVVTLPYFRSIVSGWEAERSGVAHTYLKLGWRMPWTLVTACGVAAAAAWPGLRRAWTERRRAALWLGVWALGMAAFACVVHLPQDNEHKFVWQVFMPLAVIGGVGFPALLAGVRRRLGAPLSAAVLAIAFVLPSVLFLVGYASDPAGASAPETHRGPAERELYAWVRTHTPVDAVFADDRGRDVLLVESRRRLLVGTVFGPEKAAFPSGEMAHRRAVMADLYSSGSQLAADAACLDSLGAPAYVLYRAEDHDGRSPWAALDADSGGFERVYADADGHRVYRRKRP
jgi:hypothetical protein